MLISFVYHFRSYKTPVHYDLKKKENRMESGRGGVIWLLLLGALLQGALSEDIDCINSCICDSEAKSLSCENATALTLNSLFDEIANDTLSLNIDGANIQNFSKPLDSKNLTDLIHISLKNCNISHLNLDAFRFLPKLQSLDLSWNNLSSNFSQEFLKLERLVYLNLSHNNIQEIDPNAFDNLDSLEVLDLSFNNLTMLSKPYVFHNLHSLQVLRLDHNGIRYVHPAIFRGLRELNTLNLDSNEIEALSDDLFDNMTLTELHLGQNPWHCHCGMEWLVTNVQDSDSNTLYMNSDSIQCHLPNYLEATRLQDVNRTELNCEAPVFDVTPLSESYVVWHTYYLHCNASGYPRPSIYWDGPRGVLVHPSQQQFLPADIQHFSHKQTFNGFPYHKATVTAMANGSLEFQTFRYNYIGNYTCVAVNPVNSLTTSAFIELHSEITFSVIFTVIFGALVSLAFLTLGIVIGTIGFCRRKCKSRDLHLYFDDDYEEEAQFWDEYFRHPLDRDRPKTPDIWPSPVKCITPAELTAGNELSDMNRGIFNTLVDVRSRLSENMGKHMENMRTRANHMAETGQNLKLNMNKKVERVRYKAYLMRENAGNRMSTLRESSSATLRNFKSSSGQYAHRMREGMAERAGAMKDSLKSVKEFCGNTHLDQTISVPSISTNVDSQESEEVFKNITTV